MVSVMDCVSSKMQLSTLKNSSTFKDIAARIVLRHCCAADSKRISDYQAARMKDTKTSSYQSSYIDLISGSPDNHYLVS